MNKVISFSLYGIKAIYLVGMKENIILAKQYYPDWIVWIYHNDTVPAKFIDEYVKLGAECILKRNIGRNKKNWEGMFWRWLPLDDPTVSHWISRDADSRLGLREANIVNQWIESGKTLHVIRDHRCHMHCIMGGLFGINNIEFRKKYQFKKVDDIIRDSYSQYNERAYNVDQEFLNSKFWALLKDDVIGHISNQGRKVCANDIDIPADPNNFIGRQYRINYQVTDEISDSDNDMLMNNQFRIKSAYDERCIDVVGDKISLRKVSNSDNQLWSLNERNEITHVLTQKYLHWDYEGNLTLSSHKNTWTFESCGFITCNNKAIDIKGGLSDKRNEVWMYNLNYSQAQQWEWIIHEDRCETFRIKSEHSDYCIDIADNKIALKYLSDDNSQLWKLNEDNSIVSMNENMYLSFNHKNELILSMEKTVWNFHGNGLITSDNKAIDIAGGITSERNEVWMYRINNTQAQQWQRMTNKDYIHYKAMKQIPKEKKKTLLILNHDYHHKNKKGMEMICEFLNYEIIYGSITDIRFADIVYCPSRPHNASKWPDKKFIFGPHHSIFPEERLLKQINNANNSVYIQPSPWARDVWINRGAEKYLPIKSFPFPVEIDMFKPTKEKSEKTDVFVMFKHRHPDEMKYIENYMKSKNIPFRSFRYGAYKQEDYLHYLQTCKYGIWLGRHESQGFALEEALSCDIPLLVWSVTNMRQQHGWSGCPDVPGTTIAFWDERCGEYFEKQEDFEKTYELFLQKLDTYRPREFIENTVSVKQCAENLVHLFETYKVLTCANSDYFNALKSYINNFKEEDLNMGDLIIYDIGLTPSQVEELMNLQIQHNFTVHKLDFSKYPEHINLNLEKWKGLYNSYGFKPVVIYNALQTINCNMIYTDVGMKFKKHTFSVINNHVCENDFWILPGNKKGSIESLELNHRDTLKHFHIDVNEFSNYQPGLMGMNYHKADIKKLVDDWYKYSLIQEVLTPCSSNRNNHRQDLTLMSCLLYQKGYKAVNLDIQVRLWHKPGCSTYYNNYTKFGCRKINSNKNESLIYVKNFDEAVETYANRKNITKAQLLENFVIHKF